MKTTFTSSPRALNFLFILMLCMSSYAQEFGGTFDARTEEQLGKSAYSTDGWMQTSSTTWTPMAGTFAAGYRGMAANFLAENNGTRVAVYFTAETKGSSMEVRAVVDGVPMDPGPITFSTGSHAETRAFVFTDVFNKGIHSLRIEWRCRSRFGTAFVRDASLKIRKDDNDNVGNMQIVSSPNQAITNNGFWTNIPNTTLSISTNPDEVLIASLAMEVKVDPGKSLFVRGIVDGMPSVPENVLYARGNQIQARTMTFGFSGLSSGRHTVSFQWLVQEGGAATSNARSMVLSAMPSEATDCEPHAKYKAATSGPNVSTSGSVWQPIPDMDIELSVPENGEIAVVFSAETSVEGNKNMLVRMKINNQVLPASNVLFAKGDKHMGIHSYVFVAKHLNAKGNAGLEDIQLEWRVPISGGNKAYLGDRSMYAIVEKGGIPDLAEPPTLGTVPHALGNGQSGIEPLQGNVPVLAIMIDPGRPAHPAPTLNALNDQLFGNHSTQDYYERVSGGRFTLSKAGLYGFQADAANPEHYWTHHTCDAANDTVCDNNPCITDGYAGGHLERWAEAIDKVNSSGFNFAAYDKNKDGTLDPRELAILIITPQNNEFGTVRVFNPYCPTQANPDGRYVVDGVRIIACAEWYTAANSPKDFSTPTHELGHLLLNLGDLYIDNANVATEAGTFDLMGDNGNATPYFQGRTRLALGWATPVFVRQTGNYTLENVRTNEDVYILPRINQVDGKEFFLLENRRNQSIDPDYDENIYGDGIAVWHIVESPTHYNFTPKPVSCDGNWALTDNGKARRTARLLRMQVTKHVINGNVNCELWKTPPLAGVCNPYTLNSTGFACPAGPNSGRNVVVWADNFGSGYALKNWPQAANSMTIRIEVPFGLAPDCPEDRDELGITAGDDKVAYLGLPSQSWVQLTASAHGCRGPYLYRWSNGATTPSIWVNPSTTTTYTVTVIAIGRNCIATDDVTVTVEDVRCGWNNNGVQVCYQGNNLCVSPIIAQLLWLQGATLGYCNRGNTREGFEEEKIAEESFSQVFPNPFKDQTNIQFRINHASLVKVTIFNLQGQLIETLFENRVEAGEEKTITWKPVNHPDGLYIYRISSESGVLMQGKMNLLK